jgi:hypothetical protein
VGGILVSDYLLGKSHEVTSVNPGTRLRSSFCLR